MSRRFKADSFYGLEGRQFERLWNIALRLYSEKSFKIDEMRDTAQVMDAVFDQVSEYETKETEL